MELTTEQNTYLSLKDKYGKVINFQCLIIGASGWGKGLATSGIVSKLHSLGALILCISDCKNELELAYIQQAEEMDKKAVIAYKTNPEEAINMISDFSLKYSLGGKWHGKK